MRKANRKTNATNAVNGPRTRIALLDHLGGGNLGDDATLATVMHNIKARWPDATLVALCMNPKDTHKRHGVPSYPIRYHSWDPQHDASQSSNAGLKNQLKSMLGAAPTLSSVFKVLYNILLKVPSSLCKEILFLTKSFRIANSLDLLVICGGGQLLDCWGGVWAFPYTLFKWVVLARLCGAKCYFVNVGAGPITHPLSKLLIKRALLLAEYISFRDHGSRKLVQELGFTRRAAISVDCVYGLPIARNGNTFQSGQAAPIVGIAPMAYCDPRIYWDKRQDAYDNFINTLGTFGAWLLRHEYRVALFSTDIFFDMQAIEELKASIRSQTLCTDAGQIIHEPIRTIDELLAQMAEMNYVVTCRFHGVVFAHLLNTPVLALSHHAKVSTLMSDLALSEYCLDISATTPERLCRTFESMLSNREKIRKSMADRLNDYKGALSLQFDALFDRSGSGFIPLSGTKPGESRQSGPSGFVRARGGNHE